MVPMAVSIRACSEAEGRSSIMGLKLGTVKHEWCHCRVDTSSVGLQF